MVRYDRWDDPPACVRCSGRLRSETEICSCGGRSQYDVREVPSRGLTLREARRQLWLKRACRDG
jgi:hypothetical protein